MSETQTRKPDRAGIAIAIFLLVVAAVITWDSTTLQLAPTYGLGPKMMAYVVAAGMAVIGIANLIMALQGGFPERESYDPKAIILILGGFAALIAIIALGGGFIPATAVLFAATAAAFGRKAVHIDLLIGAVLAVAVYLLFDKVLTLSLPAGPLERLL
jgi:putative tricarboxylic transport membrane protein